MEHASKLTKPILNSPRKKQDQSPSGHNTKTTSPRQGLSRNTTTLNVPSTKTLNVKSQGSDSHPSRAAQAAGGVTPDESAETPAHIPPLDERRYVNIIDQG